jgi:hypothetical protein
MIVMDIKRPQLIAMVILVLSLIIMLISIPVMFSKSSPRSQTAEEKETMPIMVSAPPPAIKITATAPPRQTAPATTVTTVDKGLWSGVSLHLDQWQQQRKELQALLHSKFIPLSPAATPQSAPETTPKAALRWPDKRDEWAELHRLHRSLTKKNQAAAPPSTAINTTEDSSTQWLSLIHRLHEFEQTRQNVSELLRTRAHQ